MLPQLKEEVEFLKRRQIELRTRMRHFHLTIGPLDADLHQAQTEFKKHTPRKESPSQFWGRIVIRCYCANIEARLFSFRKMAEEFLTLSKVQITDDELDILREERTIERNGVKKNVPKFLPFSDSVKESFRLFAKSMGWSVVIDYGSSGFQSLCKTFEIRNQLMHPKRIMDVEVRADDIETTRKGAEWFCQAYARVVDECSKYNEESLKKTRAQSTAAGKT